MDAHTTAPAIHWLAIVVAALAGFPLGMLWYGPLFRNAWMAATGVTMEQGRAATRLQLETALQHEAAEAEKKGAQDEAAQSAELPARTAAAKRVTSSRRRAQ